MTHPTDEEIAAWADGFIVARAFNRPVAVQIAMEAAKWVRDKAQSAPAPSYDVPQGECTAPDCACEPGICIQRMPVKFTPIAQSAAAPQVPTRNYVQPVPDHCDRIVWRNHYYHLPLAAAGQSAPGPRTRGVLVVAPRMTACPQCAEHPGQMDVTGDGDFDTCDRCNGTAEVPADGVAGTHEPQQENGNG